MAHWFHRNPLKATAPMKFDLGAQASTPLARHMCNDIRQAREKLLAILPDPNQDLGILNTAVETYFSLLLGFIEATGGGNKPEQPQSTSDGELISEEEASSSNAGPSGNDSTLRNAFKIKWSNSLGGKNMEMKDMVFEHVNMLCNVALWYTKHAAKLAGSQEDISDTDAKEVHKCLRSAAGMFKYVEDNLLPKLYENQGNGSDTDSRILQAYVLQCTAEAQEVTLARAISLKHTSSLISALAYETGKLFRKGADALKSVEETLVNKWRRYFALKSAFYLAQAHCYNGQTLLTQDKCGEAVRALKESERLYSQAETLSEQYASTKGAGVSVRPEQHPFFRRLRPVVKRILEKVERENGFIYHQSVPVEVPELEMKATFGLASPVEYQAPTKSKEWTSEAYAGFKMVPPDQGDKKKSEKDEPIKPVKEVPIEQTDKDQSSCVIS